MISITKNEERKAKSFGFTLIELLVVISIIGILAALSLASFTTAQRQARDTQRKSDIKQFQSSLESYANKNNTFYPSRPDASGVGAATTLCTDLSMTGCPADPSVNDTTGLFVYKYQSDGTASDGTALGTQYVLWDKLESSDKYWVICSGGKVGTIDTASWNLPVGGVCPL
ncbi:MAG: type II secretion system protein [Candidatus Woesebacteria bacterium]|nr:MAG: type II secretion system protein [Candidatus Woesebacteria bacterium]